nr:MAG TPA: hypothetical protein [Caudoviricetes sp.]
MSQQKILKIPKKVIDIRINRSYNIIVRKNRN